MSDLWISLEQAEELSDGAEVEELVRLEQQLGKTIVGQIGGTGKSQLAAPFDLQLKEPAARPVAWEEPEERRAWEVQVRGSPLPPLRAGPEPPWAEQ